MQILIIILIAIILLILFTSIYAYYVAPFTQESLFDTVPGFVYINLENREDRKKLILEEFEKLNIPKEKIYRLAGIPIPKNGHKGCVQSHILALEIAKLNRWQYVAIFEDDAELTVSHSEFKEKVSNAMKEDWDVIILHGANQSVKTKINDNMYYAQHSTQSTGYIIKESYYDTLLELFRDCNMRMSKDKWMKDGWEGNALDQRWNELIEKDNWIAINNIMKQRAISSSIMQSFNNTDEKLLVFTSAGNNTNFDELWTDKERKYDIWCVYYGDNETNYNKYKDKVDRIWKRKGSKFQNLYYIYNNFKNELLEYSRFFILDDDIIMSTQDINNMFKISKEYNLLICQPAFTPESKISHRLTLAKQGNILRYTNFVEVNTPLFSYDAFIKTMSVYDSSLIGWGIDYLYIWVNGLDHTDKYAVIDSIVCTNPHDNIKGGVREMNLIKNFNKESVLWSKYANKIGAPNRIKIVEYSTISK